MESRGAFADSGGAFTEGGGAFVEGRDAFQESSGPFQKARLFATVGRVTALFGLHLFVCPLTGAVSQS